MAIIPKSRECSSGSGGGPPGKGKLKDKMPQRGLGVAQLEKIRIGSSSSTASTNPKKLVPVIDLEDGGEDLGWRERIAFSYRAILGMQQHPQLANTLVNKLPTPSAGVGLQTEHPLIFNEGFSRQYSMPPSWPERNRKIVSPMVGMKHPRSSYIDNDFVQAFVPNETLPFNSLLKNKNIRDDESSFSVDQVSSKTFYGVHRDKRAKGNGVSSYGDHPSLDSSYLAPTSAYQLNSKCSNYQLSRGLTENGGTIDIDPLFYNSYHTSPTVTAQQSMDFPVPHLCGYPEFNSALNQGTMKDDILRFERQQEQPVHSFFPMEPNASERDLHDISDGVDLDLKL